MLWRRCVVVGMVDWLLDVLVLWDWVYVVVSDLIFYIDEINWFNVFLVVDFDIGVNMLFIMCVVVVEVDLYVNL